MFLLGSCFKDCDGGRLLTGERHNNLKGMTPEYCKKHCFDKGYKYAGTQFYHECFCGNDKPPTKNLLPQSKCNKPCTGDKSQMCGGGCTMNIYYNS